jgi:hypothetical protein
VTAPTETLPPGVTRNTEPCWVLTYANGSEYESHDGVPHFRTAEDAQGLADTLADEDDPQAELPKPTALPAPCWQVMALCGYTLDEEEWLVCSETAELAAHAATGCDWKLTPIGWKCQDDHCDGCAEAIASAQEKRGPILLPVPVADGQEPLIGAGS